MDAVHIIIHSPSCDLIKFNVEQLNISTIMNSINNNPDLCFFTNFEIETASGKAITGNYDLSKDVVNGNLDVYIKVQKYSECTAIQHVQQLCRIIFTLTSRCWYTDCKESVAGWIMRKYQNLMPNIGDLDNIFPDGYCKKEIPKLLTFIDVHENETTSVENAMGILLKLKVITSENKEFLVYADKDGFYTDTKKFVTLHHLLCNISQEYSKNYSLIFKKWCELIDIEKIHYSPIEANQPFEPVIINDDDHSKSHKLKLFSFEENVDLSYPIDDILENATKENLKDSYIKSFEESFIKRKIIESIYLIKRGYVNPFNESYNYLCNDLFITRLDGLGKIYSEKGGVETADKIAQNEIKIFAELSGIDPSFRITRTIIVDISGERWIVQCLIPGIINYNTKLVYGFKPDENKFVIDENFKEFFDRCSKEFNIGDSLIKGCNCQVKSSSEVSGVIGSDGNKYIVDMHRTTPRDANYLDPVKYHGYIIRREAVNSFEIYKSLEKHSKELIELGGTSENQYHHGNVNATPDEIEKLEEKRETIIKEREKILFDINALTIDSKTKEVPKNILELSKYVLNVLIPNFVNDFLSKKTFNIDGQRIVDEMHSRGINVRYISKVNEELQKKDIMFKDTISLIIESEIISRSLKVLIRRNNGISNLCTFINNLNILLGLTVNENKFNELFTSIQNYAFEHFGFKPSKPKESQRILILRSLLNSLGITIYANKIDSPIKIEDIYLISPHVKFPFSNNNEINEYIEIATSLYSTGDIDKAYELFLIAVQFAEQALHTFDQSLALCYFFLAMIESSRNNSEIAFNYCMKSMIIQERYYDQAHPEIIIRYSLLSEISQQLNRPQLALAFSTRASYLSHILNPAHQWSSSAMILASEIVGATNLTYSIQYLQVALKMANESNESNKFKAQIYHSMAVASCSKQNLNKALQYLNLAIEMDPENEEIKQSINHIKEYLKTYKEKKVKK